MATNAAFWRGKRVWLSGHTGFQGTWLALWLKELGAEVYGFGLEPEENSLFRSLGFESFLDGHLISDIRNAEAVRSSFYAAQPDVVFHLAAQEDTRAAQEEPRSTWETNVLGTLNVMEAARSMPGLRAIQVITSDRCYENLPPYSPKREEDPLGGSEPYSASKAATELVVRSYQPLIDSSRMSIATCRAGNVIGPGDWAPQHIVPTIIRSIEQQHPVSLRCPQAVRPWQVVLEPLSGYLKLAEAQWRQPSEFSGAWNFGPSVEECHSVQQLVEGLFRHWTFTPTPSIDIEADAPWDERSFLQLDSMKAWGCLGWATRFSFEDALRWTAHGYHQCLSASTEELLNWMRASIFSYGALGPSAQEIILDEQYLDYATPYTSQGRPALS